ncbi:MAG: type II toxin-antitoxin system VapC family toxin [Chloroflexota bacterium]
MVVDSNIVIYAGKPGYPTIRKFIDENPCMVSATSLVEVLGYHQLTSADKTTYEHIFQQMTVLPLTSPIIDQAILLRQKRKINLGDAFIGATAIFYNLPLVTADVKHFRWIDKLTVVNPLTS